MKKVLFIDRCLGNIIISYCLGDSIEMLFGSSYASKYSVPANIFKGYKKQTKAHQIHYHNISDTSLEELKYYFILSKDLNYITEKEYKILMSKSEEVGRMIASYIKHIDAK